jgi:hypothetical protein
MSVWLQTFATETHLAEGLTLEWCQILKVEKSLTGLVGTYKLTVLTMEEKLICLHNTNEK